MARLDTQRPPLKLNPRLSARLMTRGFDVVPHTIWGEQLKVSPSRSAAAPGDVFAPETTITASDGTNAARLAGLGFIALPLTAWTTAQKIVVGGFNFNWSGAAWAAGAHA